MSEKKQKIAEKLKLAREQSGLSQGQVAKKLNYNRPTISEIEAGRRNITAEEISQFCDLYEIDPSWLLGTKNTDENPKVQLAARKLSKLSEKELNGILNLLQSLKENQD